MSLRPQRSSKFIFRKKRKLQERKLKKMRGTQRTVRHTKQQTLANRVKLMAVHNLVCNIHKHIEMNIYSPSLTSPFTSGLYFFEHP